MTLDRKVGMYWFYAPMCANFNIAYNFWSIQSTVQSVHIWYAYPLRKGLSDDINICPLFLNFTLTLLSGVNHQLI